MTTFKDEADALEIANDTMYGLARASDSRHEQGSAWPGHQGRACGRTATTSIPRTRPGGYKVSGVGRENHKMMLDHYTQTKCLLVSYDPKPLGLF